METQDGTMSGQGQAASVARVAPVPALSLCVHWWLIEIEIEVVRSVWPRMRRYWTRDVLTATSTNSLV